MRYGRFTAFKKIIGGKSMSVFKVIMKYADGEEEMDEVFETEEEADEYGADCVSNYYEGGRILEMSNPGDYPFDEDEEVDYEVVEADEE